jgi:hypothetical protein
MTSPQTLLTRQARRAVCLLVCGGVLGGAGCGDPVQSAGDAVVQLWFLSYEQNYGEAVHRLCSSDPASASESAFEASEYARQASLTNFELDDRSLEDVSSMDASATSAAVTITGNRNHEPETWEYSLTRDGGKWLVCGLRQVG